MCLVYHNCPLNAEKSREFVLVSHEREHDLMNGLLDSHVEPLSAQPEKRHVTMQEAFKRLCFVGFYLGPVVNGEDTGMRRLQLPQAPVRIGTDPQLDGSSSFGILGDDVEILRRHPLFRVPNLRPNRPTVA